MTEVAAPSRRALVGRTGQRIAERFLRGVGIATGVGPDCISKATRADGAEDQFSAIDMTVSLGRGLGQYAVQVKTYAMLPDTRFGAVQGIERRVWERYVKREVDGERVIIAFVDCVLRRLYWCRLPDMLGPFEFEDLTGRPPPWILPSIEMKYGTTEQLYWPVTWFHKVVAEWDSGGLHDRDGAYGTVPNWVALSDAEADALHALRAPSSLSGIARLASREDERAAYLRFAADWTRRNDQMALF